MSNIFGFKKSSIVFATILLSTSMIAKAGIVYDFIISENKLIIATDANWAPFSYIDDDGVMQGFDVEVGREIAKRMGVEAEFITPDWDVITAGHWNARWDVSVGSMTPTASRSEVLNFQNKLIMLSWLQLSVTEVTATSLLVFLRVKLPKSYKSQLIYTQFLL